MESFWDGFRFEHPTQQGQLEGGWMTRLSDKPDSAGFGRLLEQGQVAETVSVAAAAAAAPAAQDTTVKRMYGSLSRGGPGGAEF